MAAPLVPSGFFHLRTPLLPADRFDAVAAGGGATLSVLAAQAPVAEALYLASPGLVHRWRSFVDRTEAPGPTLAAIERAVAAYVVRMATRPTPFGLFAGVATGRVAGETRLDVPPVKAHQRRSRIDAGVLAEVAEAVERDADSRGALLFSPTTSLYRAGGHTRYVEARTAASVRSHHLVAVDEDAALAAALARAGDGATVGQLAAALAGPDVSLEEADAYVGELIAAGILVSDLQPAITGPDPVAGMIEVLRRSPRTDKAASRLAQARAILAELDRGGLGRPPDSYAAVHGELAELVPGLDAAHLVQVDLSKPSPRLTIGPEITTELGRAVELLGRLSPSHDEALARFKAAFEERYGERRVPLCEVLDEEAGIGYEPSAHPGAEEAPLLAGLDLGPPPSELARPFGRPDRALVDLLVRTLVDGRLAVELTEADIAGLAEPDPAPLPCALAVMATVLGSPNEVGEGRFRLLVHGAGGPSGAQLLGRFCAGDAELESAVRVHLAAEEAHRPDAIHAEVVHLPEGRTGNILRRPVLRSWEIAYLGRSGADADRQLRVDELTVGLEGGRVVLRCPRLDDREVLPRLATAHNTARRSVGLYRFLAALQYQDVAGALAWSWGPLAEAPFLPRVTAGRLILARARWLLQADELRSMATPDGLARVRGARRLPRLVAVADGDHELRVDLDRPASVEIALHTLAGRDAATLVEALGGPDDLCAVGPEGAFCHELVVPFHRRITPVPTTAPRPKPADRRFPPGSAWLYLKAYCGSATTDDVLREAVVPALAEADRRGRVDRWFFVRYGDPDWHLRVRVSGDPIRLRDEVAGLLHGALGPFVADGRVWRVQLDTYEREVERYGGPAGVLLAEEAFHADSEATAGIVGLLDGDHGADARWRLTLLGTHLLLDDLGFTLEERLAWTTRQRHGFLREFPGSQLTRQLGRRFRTERNDLEALLWGGGAGGLAPGVELLRARSVRVADVGRRLHALAGDGGLGIPVGAWAASVAHMHANRLLRSAARAQELVIHDLLARLYRSRMARTSPESVHRPLNRVEGD